MSNGNGPAGLEPNVSRLMAIGLGTAAMLMVAGMALSLSGNANGANLSTFGIYALIATPILRVFMCLNHFAGEKDWRYVALTAWVLVAMLIGMALGAA